MRAAAVGPGADGFVELGHVIAAHGIKGQLKLKLYGPGDVIAPGARLIFRTPGGATTEHQVASVVRDRKRFLVALSDIPTMTDAERLVGARVEMRRDEMPPAAPDEYYVCDLIGCAVIDGAGQALGTVTDFIETGAAGVIAVTGPQGERLYPLVRHVVLDIDIARRQIVIDPALYADET